MLSTFIKKAYPYTHIKVILLLLLFAVLRSIADDIWYYNSLEMYLLTLLNTIVYIYTLYLSANGLTLFLLSKFWKIKYTTSDLRKIYSATALLWLTYPMVGVISGIAESPYSITIPIFRYLPFFMVENNFFPLGMIVMVPLLIIGYTYAFHQKPKRFWTTLIAVVLSFSIIYILFYQYVLRLSYIIYDVSNIYVFGGFYTTSFIVFICIFISPFEKAFNIDQKETKNYVFRRIINFWFILCVLIAFYGLIISFVPHHESKQNSFKSEGIEKFKWNLFFFVVPNNTELLSYGYILKSNSCLPSMFFKVDSSVFSNYSELELNNNGFRIQDLYAVFDREEETVFNWNESPKGSHPFFNTFEGSEYLSDFKLYRNDSIYSGFYLEENLQANADSMLSWEYQIFTFIKNDFFDLCVFQYDGYADGVIKINNHEYKNIRSVKRASHNIEIDFEIGKMTIDFKVLADYDVYHVSNGPVEQVIKATVKLYLDGSVKTFDSVFGHIEILENK